jgi:lipopolysaccharide export system ATP-binding protein
VATILRGSDLTKRYLKLTVVDSVSIEVRAGEVVGLLGPNGAGKSTVFAMLSGQVPVDEGQVHLNGEKITGWPMYRRVRAGISYLPQAPSVFRDLSVWENLRVASDASDAELKRQLQGSGLDEHLSLPAGQLSGGLRRRLEVLRCLVQRPSILLLDEPFAGMDPLHISYLRVLIADMRAEGIGVLLTDHAVREVLPLCDRALILDNGIVQCQGTPSVVADDTTVRSRYLGHDFDL